MIRFFIRCKRKLPSNGLEFEELYSIEADCPVLESLLRTGGFGEDAYEFHQLVGCEIILQPKSEGDTFNEQR